MGQKKRNDPCLSYFFNVESLNIVCTPYYSENWSTRSLVQSTSTDLYFKVDWNKNAHESFFIFKVPEIKISGPIVVVDWNLNENNDIIYMQCIYIVNCTCTHLLSESWIFIVISSTVHINTLMYNISENGVYTKSYQVIINVRINV